MIEKRGNRLWYRAVKSYFKLGKKGRVSHVVATMAACLTLGAGSPALAETVNLTVDSALTETYSIANDGDNTYNLIVTENGSITVTDGPAITTAEERFKSGSVINSGTISCTNTGSEEWGAGLSFIYVDENALLSNIGTIKVNNSADNAWNAGMLAGDVSNSTMSNSGTITLTGSGEQSTEVVTLLGMAAGRLGSGSTMENAVNGTITLTTTLSGGNANLAGMWASKLDDTSNITNSGTMNLSIALDDEAESIYAGGINVGSVMTDSSVTNSGAIIIDMTLGEDVQEAYAYGIFVDGSQDVYAAVSEQDNKNNTIENSGVINITATLASGVEDVEGAGIWVGSDLTDSTVINSGDMNITMFGDDQTHEIYAAGIVLDSDVSGSTIENAGTMTLSVQGGDYAGLYGMYAQNIDAASAVTNSGTITISSTSRRGWLSGIEANDLEYGSAISNSGTITLTADMGSDGVYMFMGGIRTDDLIEDCAVTNSGTISMTLAGSSQVTDSEVTSSSSFRRSQMVGMYAEYLYAGSITNSGTITMDSSTDSSVLGGMLVGESLLNSTMENSGTIEMVTSGEDSRVLGMGFGAFFPGGKSLEAQSTVEASGGVAGEGIIKNSGFIDISSSSALSISVGMMVRADTLNEFALDVDETTLAVENSGTISLTSSAFTFQAGMYVYGDTTATNSGTISVTADTDEYSGPEEYLQYMRAMGVYTNDADVVNTGTITASLTNGTLNENFYSVWAGGNLTNSGTLKGRLYTAGNTVNSGTIQLAPGTSTVVGNFTQTKEGTLGVTVNTDDPGNFTSSSLDVVGTATLEDGSTLAVDITTMSVAALHQTVEGVITSDNTIDVNPDALNVIGGSALIGMEAALSQDNTSMDLTIEQTMSVEDAVQQGGQKFAAGAGAVLNELLESDDPQIAAFMEKLLSQATVEEVADMVAQLVPVCTTQASATTGQVVSAIKGVIQARQGGMAGGNSGDMVISEKNAWVKPFATFMDQDDDNGTPGFSADSYGVGMGADGELLSGSTVGVAFFYTNTDADTNDMPQSMDMDVINLMFYGSKALNPARDLTLYWQAGGGVQDTETKRVITGAGTAKADYWGTNLFAQVSGIKAFDVGHDVMLTGGAVISYSWLRTPSYSEEGVGGLGLDVQSSSTQSLVPALEGGVTWTPATVKGLAVNANVSVGYDVIDDDAAVTSSFQGAGPSFTTDGIDNSALIYSAGISVGQQITDRFSLEAGYDFEGRGGDLMTHMASCKLNWKF